MIGELNANNISYLVHQQGVEAMNSAFNKFNELKRIVYYRSRRDYVLPEAYIICSTFIASNNWICSDYLKKIGRVIYKDRYIDDILSMGEIYKVTELFAQSLASYRWISWVAAQSRASKPSVIKVLGYYNDIVRWHYIYGQFKFKQDGREFEGAYGEFLYNIVDQATFMQLVAADVPNEKKDCYAAIQRYLIRCLSREIADDYMLLRMQGIVKFFLHRGWKHDPSYESVLVNFKKRLQIVWDQKYIRNVEEGAQKSDDHDSDSEVEDLSLAQSAERSFGLDRYIAVPLRCSTFRLISQLRAYSYCGVIKRDVQKTIKELKLLRCAWQDPEIFEKEEVIFKKECKDLLSFECAKLSTQKYAFFGMSDSIVSDAVVQIQGNCKKIVLENIIYCSDLVQNKASEKEFLKM